MRYTKLEATLRERVVFLFTGLLSDKLYNKWKCVLESNNNTKAVLIESQSTPLQEEKVYINNKEEIKQEGSDFKMDIPFFDLNEGKTKSNL